MTEAQRQEAEQIRMNSYCNCGICTDRAKHGKDHFGAKHKNARDRAVDAVNAAFRDGYAAGLTAAGDFLTLIGRDDLRYRFLTEHPTEHEKAALEDEK